MQPFPQPNNASDKIWLRSAHWLQRYSCLKLWTTKDRHRSPISSPTSLRLRWAKNWILTSIKGYNSAANLQKMKIYNPNIDLVNDNVYTYFLVVTVVWDFTNAKLRWKSTENYQHILVYMKNISLFYSITLTNISCTSCFQVIKIFFSVEKWPCNFAYQSKIEWILF